MERLLPALDRVPDPPSLLRKLEDPLVVDDADPFRLGGRVRPADLGESTQADYLHRARVEEIAFVHDASDEP